MKLIYILLLLLVVTGCAPSEPIPVCDIQKTIITVGGCDRRGICGVIYSGGTYGTEFRPVVGQTVLRCF